MQQGQPDSVVVRNDTLNKTVRGLALIQVIIGIVSVLLGIASVIVSTWRGNIHQGIWGGLWILVTGIIGMASSKNLKNCCVTGTYMAFSIVSSAVAFITGIIFVTAIVYYKNCYMYTLAYWGQRCDEEIVSAGLGINIPFLILMIIEFFVSIVAAVYACKSSSCCSCCTQQQPGIVISQQQQQYGIATSNQGGAGAGGYQMVPNYPDASCPTTGYYQPQYPGYPQQVGVMSAPEQMHHGQILSKPHTGVSPQDQQIPAETNIVYSAQPTAPTTYMDPPPYSLT